MISGARRLDEDKALPGRGSRGRERRCIATGEVLPEEKLVRFVADPDGNVVPDVAARLPGRGMWVRADRASVEKAVAKNHFSKASKESLAAAADLADRVEQQLVARMKGDLGLARKSGVLVLGFDNVARALDSARPPSVLVAASDGAADGRRKLANAARARGLDATIIDCLDCHELSLALGRENVIHAALLPGGLAERLVTDASRLGCFRHGRNEPEKAGVIPAVHERHE